MSGDLMKWRLGLALTAVLASPAQATSPPAPGSPGDLQLRALTPEQREEAQMRSQKCWRDIKAQKLHGQKERDAYRMCMEQ